VEPLLDFVDVTADAVDVLAGAAGAGAAGAGAGAGVIPGIENSPPISTLCGSFLNH
jgi:hypothetical protein